MHELSTSTPVDLLSLVKIKAKEYDMDWVLAAGLISVESAWNPSAVRFEPFFKYLMMPLDFSQKLSITLETENTCQRTSWGLMQIMGATARSLGFTRLCTELVYPDVNLDWGLKLLKTLTKRYPNRNDVISAYNAGSAQKVNGSYANQTYVDRVTAAISKL